jgi:glycosyltransferase involved in cell wall biosynthesis
VIADRIRLTFLLNGLDVGGVETIIAKTIGGLDRRRYEIRVIALQKGSGALADLVRPLGAECFDVGVASRFDLFALCRLARLLRGVDVLHTATFHSNILGRLLGKLMRVPVILGSEVIVDFESPFRLALNRWTAGIPSVLICNAEAVRRYVVATLRVPGQKAVTVYQGLDVEAYPPKRGRGDPPVIGTVGRLHPQKGYPYLIEAAAMVQRTQPRVRWVCVGEGPERPRLEARIRERGLTEVVELAGYCGDMRANLARFDYYVHPAIAEGLPYSLMEAMAAGLPVVATNVGGTGEMVEHNVSGVLVPPADPAALAGAVLHLLAAPKDSARLGSNARERIRLHFPERTMAEAEDRLIRLHLKRR